MSTEIAEIHGDWFGKRIDFTVKSIEGDTLYGKGFHGNEEAIAIHIDMIRRYIKEFKKRFDGERKTSYELTFRRKEKDFRVLIDIFKPYDIAIADIINGHPD